MVKTFLDTPGWKVRSITRDPSKDAGKTLAARGVDAVQADLNDIKSLEAAFKGAHAIFAVTDFWAPFFNSTTKSKLKPGEIINKYCYDLELKQIQNIADAAAKADDGTLKSFIWSSLPDVKKMSKGKYQWAWHFDSKAAGTDYIHNAHPDLTKKMSVIYITFYASNAFHRIKKLEDGSFEYIISAPGDVKQPTIVTKKDTGPFVKTLVDLPPGKTLLAYSSLTSPNEFIDIWTRLNGVTAHTRQLSLAELEKASPDAGREIGESSIFAAEFGFDGGDPSVIHPKDVSFTRRRVWLRSLTDFQLGVDVPSTSIEEYIKGEDWSSVLDQKHRSLLR